MQDRYSFSYNADAHYYALLDMANELYQRGVVCLSTRQDMVTEALGAYSWHVEDAIGAEQAYCSRYIYAVYDGDCQVMQIHEEGVIYGMHLDRIGFIRREYHGGQWLEFAYTCDERLIGQLDGMQITRADRPPLSLKRIDPPRYTPRTWRLDID